MATWSLPLNASSGRKSRPRIGCTPSVDRSDGVATRVRTRSGAAPLTRLASPSAQAPTSESARFCFCRSRKSGYENGANAPGRALLPTLMA